MGLWDILVPAEPGVLHNTIANPSFEYDTGQVTKIYGKYSPKTVNTTYWNPLIVPASGTITASKSYAGSLFPQQQEITITATTGTPFSASDPYKTYVYALVNGKYENLGLITGYTSDTVVTIANYIYSNLVTAATFTLFYPSIEGSTEWASRGQKSLKIQKGIPTGGGFEYYPRGTSFVAPTLTPSTTTTGGTIAASKPVTFAVMGLTDIGMSLANGITDAQVQPVSSLVLPSHTWLYPSIDSRRGHGTLTYSSTVTTGGTSTNQVFLDIIDNSTSRETSPRGWAVWYSTDATFSGGNPTGGTYMLAGVYPNTTAYMDGTISVQVSSSTVTGVDTSFTTADIGRSLYTTNGVLIGTITSRSSATSVSFSPYLSSVTGFGIGYRMSTSIKVANIIEGVSPDSFATGTISVNPVAQNSIIGVGTNFVSTDVGRHIYINSTNNQKMLVGTISSYVGPQQVTLSTNAQFIALNSQFYISTETNPNSFPNNSQGSIRMFKVTGTNTYSPAELSQDCSAPYWGVTNAAYGGFTKKHHLYFDWYLSADNAQNPNTTYSNTGADWSVYLVNNSPSPTETLLGTLDSTGTTAAAERMGLRTKFLIDRPSAGTNTSDMRLRFKYTGAGTSDAALYIDGVQFVDVGMIWRAYDWYGSTIGTETTPPQFSDWDWNDVEFTYIDGDTPGGMWSDSMPTQSGTTSASFPYITNNGVWMRDQYEYEVPSATTNAGGYAGPRFRLNYQWRNTASPVFGVSVPGLSQSSMQTQTFTTGFWAPLSTSNINVVVEPSISGVGMPEIATTSIEYGIVDGGYVQRQVARMRNLQFTVTISAQSWTGMHANRRSLINLLKFDQLSQQGERRMRYRGAETPLWMSVTYQSGLEYSGTQGVSFTEALGIRFLSTDPYFYVDANITVDSSPVSYNKLDFSHVLFKLGNDSEWSPLSHRYYTQNTASNQIAGNTYFFDSTNGYAAPYALGWIQSPSGSISALVVGGPFTKPVPYLAVFYVSGYNDGLYDSSTRLKSVQNSTEITGGAGTLTTTAGSASATITGNFKFSGTEVGKHLFTNAGQYIGRIKSVNSVSGANTALVFFANAAVSFSGIVFYVADIDTNTFQSLPNNVYLHNIFMANGDVNVVYQESENSVLIAGALDNITEMQSTEPTAYGTGYISSGSNTTVPIYKNRVFRLALSDAGRVTVTAVDDVFTKTTTATSVTNTSSLYSLLYYAPYGNPTPISNSITSLTKTPSNYVIAATNGNNSSSTSPYDLTLPAIINRSQNAFAIEGTASGIVGIDPVGNAIIVGSRQTIAAYGKITITRYSTKITGKGTDFSATLYNRGIFLVGGLYVGKIAYAESATVAYLSEPATINATSVYFEISADMSVVSSDKRSLRSNLYAALADYNYSTFGASNSDYYSSTWGYFNNPTPIGSISVVAGSRSLGASSNLFDSFGVNQLDGQTMTTTTTTSTATVTKKMNTPDNIGAYVFKNDGRVYVGQIKKINSNTQIELTRNANIAMTAEPIYLRSAKQLVDASGYSSVSGNVIVDYNANSASFEFNSPVTFSNAIVPDFLVQSLNYNGALTTYKIPYIFTDTISATTFIPTSSVAVSKILRRGVFGKTTNMNYVVDDVYNVDGYSIIISGANTPALTAVAGTISINPSTPANFTMSSAFYTTADYGRSIYDSNKNFLGILKEVSGTTGTFVKNTRIRGTGTITVSGTSVTGVGTLFSTLNIREQISTSPGSLLYYMNDNAPTLIGTVNQINSNTSITLTAPTLVTLSSASDWAFVGIVAQTGYNTNSSYMPYQFNLQSSTGYDPFFSFTDQGMYSTDAVAKGFSSTIKMPFAPSGLAAKDVALFGYVDYYWQYVGIITGSSATSTPSVTISAGTAIALAKNTKLMIAPVVTIWSGSANRFSNAITDNLNVIGQELYAGNVVSGTYERNYIGTITSIITANDHYARLAVAPYSYSQRTGGFVPVKNVWSNATPYSMVWLGAKQVRGSQRSNFFADAIGVVSAQPSDGVLTIGTSASSTPSVILDNWSNYIAPGLMRGALTFASAATAVTGLNTNFAASATTSNPVTPGVNLWTLDGRKIGQIFSHTSATSVTLNANTTFANTVTNYRIGSSTSFYNTIVIAEDSSIGLLNASIAPVNMIALGTTYVTNDTIYFGGVAGTNTISVDLAGTVTVGTSNFGAPVVGSPIFVKYGGVYRLIGFKATPSSLSSNLLGVAVSAVAWGYSTVTSSFTDTLVGRAIWSSPSVQSVDTYLGTVKQLTTMSLVFDTTVRTDNLGASYSSILTGTIASSSISISDSPLKWAIRPGDVLRKTTSTSSIGTASSMIGQVVHVNVPENYVSFSTAASADYGVASPASYVVQRGIGVGLGLGTVSAITSTLIIGTDTYFSTLPIPYASAGTVSSATDYFVGTYLDIYVAESGSTTYTLAGRAYSYADDVTLNISNGQLTIDSVTYNWYYVIRNQSINSSQDYLKDTLTVTDLYTNTSNNYMQASMPGLGFITTSQYNASVSNATGGTMTVGKFTGVNTITALSTSNNGTVPTQFTHQVAPGDLIMLYNVATPTSPTVYSAMGYYFRVFQVLSNYELLVTTRDGQPFPSVAYDFSSQKVAYTIFKQTNEMVAFDNGVLGYVNNDWQPLGYSQGHVNAIETAKNGDVYVGGTFAKWNKSSNSGIVPTAEETTIEPRRIGRMIIGLNTKWVVTDAYAAPVAGNYFTRDGFADGKVNAIVDNSAINPINGYIGSADSIMIGGNFRKTSDNISVDSGLAILPSSSVASTMRQIKNTDLAIKNASLTDEVNAKSIASTTRFRKYSDLVQTNTLDGINGNNLAVLYENIVTIDHTTQFKAIRVRGNASTYPIITISYSTNSNLSSNATKNVYQITQTVTGARIEFTNNALVVYNGETVIIDTRLGKRSITSNLRGNLANALSPTTNFVDFILLGANNSAGLSTQSYDDYRVNVVGVHADAGLSVTISYIPRFWSFDANNLFFGTTKAGL